MNFDQIRDQLDQFLDLEPTGDPRQKRRSEILSAARRLFTEQGYKKTSVADVAQLAGVTKPTVYAHYDGKARLLLHALALEKREHLERMRPIFDAKKTPRERLRSVVELSLKLAREMPLTARLVRGEREVLFALGELDDVKSMTGPAGARAEAMRTALQEELIEAIAPGRLSRRERRERAKVLVAMTFCSGVLAEDDIRQGLSYERTATVLAHMLAAGVDFDAN